MNARRGIKLLAASALLFPGIVFAASDNLLANGSFDNAAAPLANWRITYDLPGEGQYIGNEKLVSVVPMESGRKQVLRFEVSAKVAGWQGVKTDSAPVPIEPNGKYRFSAAAKTTGPNCRIMLEGYKWRPGIKPHANPELSELRRMYKFAQLYYGGAKGGDFGNVGRSWSTASMTLPDTKMTDLAKEKYNEVKFLVAHIVGIGGGGGVLYVDDVKIEKIN